ncbi:NUDIX hydrolase [Malaciobacter mytili]|uniref:NUDIX domain-containing protein n=1 Tax=Malaciobacter mytili TaxID=603050 RepID=UPI00100B2D4A|nr:NUDIX hydrolase [Malaciobacter mytili]RXI39673.1 NUDIX hydrolase [Malaciobacter mytili]
MQSFKHKLKTPFLATDGIIKIYTKEEKLKGIVLIQRKNPPLGFALPGGFVDVGEKVEEALKREMKEEVNLEVSIEKLLGVYSDPNRDKRFHCVSCVYICKAYDDPIAADDAKSAHIYSLNEIPFDKLTFDHEEIIKDFLKDEGL